MPDINFDCPLCLQNLDAPEDMAGEVINCPSCSREIRIPQPSAAGAEGEAKPGAEGEAKPVAESEEVCPECGAKLAEQAVICVNCGLNLKTGRKVPTKAM